MSPRSKEIIQSHIMIDGSFPAEAQDVAVDAGLESTITNMQTYL
jgi:hypothetical protein